MQIIKAGDNNKQSIKVRTCEYCSCEFTTNREDIEFERVTLDSSEPYVTCPWCGQRMVL